MARGARALRLGARGDARRRRRHRAGGCACRRAPERSRSMRRKRCEISPSEMVAGASLRSRRTCESERPGERTSTCCIDGYYGLNSPRGRRHHRGRAVPPRRMAQARRSSSLEHMRHTLYCASYYITHDITLRRTARRSSSSSSEPLRSLSNRRKSATQSTPPCVYAAARSLVLRAAERSTRPFATVSSSCNERQSRCGASLRGTHERNTRPLLFSERATNLF